MAVSLDLEPRARLAPLSRLAGERLLAVFALASFAAMSWLALRLHAGVTTDDTYITYQSARNLALGHGLVFNLGERYLSTSAPLYGFLLGVLGIGHVQAIPAISDAISFLSLIAIGAALFAYGRHIGNRWFGWIAGILAIGMPPLSYSIGFEVLPQTALILWAFYAFMVSREAKRPAYAAGVLLALAVLMRPDGLLAAGTVLLVVLGSVVKNACLDAGSAKPAEDEEDEPKALTEVKAFWESILARLGEETRALSWQAVGLFVLILAAAAVVLTLYYGSPLPGTMQAKAAQSESGTWATFGRGAYQAFIQKYPRDYPTMLGIYALAGLGLLVVIKHPRVALLVAWPLLHALAFNVGRLPNYEWYFVPISIWICVMAALGLSEVIQRMNTLVIGGWIAAALSIVLIGRLSWGLGQGLAANARTYPTDNPQGQLYPLAAEWLVQHTKPTDRIGYYEIGLIAWHSQRRFVDPLGLCTPGQADNVRRRAFDAGYRELEPEYVLKFQRSIDVMNKDTKKIVTKWGSVFGLDPDKKAWFRACYAHETDIVHDRFRIAVFRKVQSYAAWRQSRYASHQS